MIYSAPVVRKKLSDVSYSNYATSLSWSVAMSAIVGLAILALGYIALVAIITLFDISWNDTEKLFAYWAVISLILITPLYALGTIPPESNTDDKAYITNAFYAFLIRFVGIPFIILYFLILYVYSIKVIANFHEWPNGIVSWLVIVFSVFGYTVYFSSKPYESSYSFIATFRKYIPWAIIPQIAMLAYAIYLRIAQYDLTTNRYFIVLFGIWLLGISLYYTASKKKSLLVIPVSLSIIVFLFSIGPWSVYNFPLERQKFKLTHDLQEANMLTETKEIVPAPENIDS